MSLSELLGLWIAAGLMSSIGVTLLWRHSRDEALKPSIGLFLAIVATGPSLLLILVLLLIYAAVMPKSKETAAVDGSREGLLCNMINLRLEREPEPSRPAQSENWMMWQLEQTPEADLLAAVEMFVWDRDSVEPLSEAKLTSDEDDYLANADRRTLGSYAATAMSVRNSGYLRLGNEHLERTTAMATTWVLKDIRRAFREPHYPPRSWFTTQLSWNAVKEGRFEFAIDIDELERGSTRSSVQWRTMLSRRTEDDEIWSFNSPAEYWEKLGGRAGLVLVRRGVPIAAVTLVMN